MNKTPINLNRYRKQKARDAKRARADANAAKFGRTKGARAAQDAERDRADRALDGHQRPNPVPDDPPDSAP